MKIGIYGTGAFGLALSSILKDNNNEITMWTKFPEEKEILTKEKGNKKALPNYKLSTDIKITNDLNEVTLDKDLLIIALPVPFIEDLLKEISSSINDISILIASKGIDKNHLLVSEIINKYTLNNNIGVIGGPNFAHDIVEKNPVAMTIATTSEEVRKKSMLALKNKYVKLEFVNNKESIELLGAIKNVYAIIAGVFKGMESNTSTMSFLYTEMLKDEKRILEYLGCNKEDILTYAGLGDLILTCSDEKSRNHTFGEILGRDGIEKAKEYLNENTVEGYNTLENIKFLIIDNKIDMPLFETLLNIIEMNASPEQLIEKLMEI